MIKLGDRIGIWAVKWIMRFLFAAFIVHELGIMLDELITHAIYLAAEKGL